jgi:hypothetical protein
MSDTATQLAAGALTFSILSFLLLVPVLFLYIYPDFATTVKAALAPGTGTTSTAGFGSMFALLGAFSPDVALLTGFISDIINGSFRYSVTSIIGVGAVVLNWLVGGLVYGFTRTSSPSVQAVSQVASTIGATLFGTGATTQTVSPKTAFSTLQDVGKERAEEAARQRATIDARLAKLDQAKKAAGMEGGARADVLGSFNPCSIRGLGMFDIAKSPMGMAALSSMFVVYFLDMTVNKKREGTDILVYSLFSLGIYALNIYSYKEFECVGDSTLGGVMQKTLIPLVIGSVAGVAGFSVLNSTFPSYLPLDHKGIGNVDRGARCSPPNDKDQFVCETYKNGKRI